MRTTALVFIAFFSTLVLTGCTALPDPEPVNLGDFPSSQTQQGQPQADIDPTELNTQQTPPVQEQRNPSMKTLEDFGQIEGRIVTLVTTKGNITFELYREQAPLTTANFLSLATTGFYDGVVFHRVIPDFMAQVGDPLSKDPTKKDSWGQGGPGYTIADEFVPELKHDGPGIVSMAKTAAPNTGGSQFFITYEATPWLDGQHSVFGKVTEGLDVLNQISVGDSITSVSIQ